MGRAVRHGGRRRLWRRVPLSFVLNRALNFRSHDPVGRPTIVYVGVVALNFAILVGVSSGLEAVGVQYQVARIAAGA
jgi:hypothetical protein